MSVARPDDGIVQQLVNMGFDEERARTAAYQSHNCGVEAAVNWLMEHPNSTLPSSAVQSSDERPQQSSANEPVVGIPADVTTIINPGGDHSFGEALGFGAECKAVLVVAENLFMSPGKIASQCAHAAVGLYKVMIANQVPWYRAFEAGGEKTVVLAAGDGVKLEALALQADQLLLPNFLVSDAGRTEVLPGSVTVLGIAGPAETVDRVTGSLRLLQ